MTEKLVLWLQTLEKRKHRTVILEKSELLKK